MKNSFENKTAIVTGGSFGIGRAAAVLFARKGCNVVIADHIEDNVTLDIIKKNGRDAIFVKCDVSRLQDVEILVEKTIEKFGRLDYAFNNAGIEGIPANTVDCTEENWNSILETNLKSVWLCMKFEIPEMLKTGKGAIVNCSSVAGLTGIANMPAYVASKHGIIGLTKTAALENSRSGIRVNAVCPGVIDTAMIDRFTGRDKKAEKQLLEMEPVGRMGTPEEVANAVIWLCSDEASFITGDSVAIDGGWLAK